MKNVLVDERLVNLLPGCSSFLVLGFSCRFSKIFLSIFVRPSEGLIITGEHKVLCRCNLSSGSEFLLCWLMFSWKFLRNMNCLADGVLSVSIISPTPPWQLRGLPNFNGFCIYWVASPVLFHSRTAFSTTSVTVKGLLVIPNTKFAILDRYF